MHTSPMPTPEPAIDPDEVAASTTRWLERAVIGLGLCPFARAVHVGGRIRSVVTAARDEEALLEVLASEAQRLAVADITQIETTLLIHPQVLQEFFDYSRFLPRATRQLKVLKLDGVLQIASFHPQYRFRDADDDDITHCSNRSPWPILHLLREDSVERAVAAFPDAARIYERNIATLRALGWDGWHSLWRKPA
jgi:hypothetical protein